MALTYLGYGEQHQKVHGQGGRFQGPLVGLTDKLDDPHDKLNLANKVKDRQIYSKVGVEVQDAALPNKALKASWNQPLPKSSKGTLWKDYTRPEKRSMVAPAAAHTSTYMRSSFAVESYQRQ